MNLLPGALSIALVASSLAVAQDRTKPAEVKTAEAEAKIDSPSFAVGAKPLTVLGKVGNDGKTFVTDIDTEWSVSNADILKGYEGRPATVKCLVDPERNRIHVLSVKTIQAQLRFDPR
jgi:hypothetical protein